MNIILNDVRIVDPVTGRDDVQSVYVRNGIIEQIANTVSGSQGDEILDLRGKVLVPGFIDMHVHLREPGFEHKETILSGCSAAAAGGFSAVCCMPNTNPAIDDASVIQFIQNKARGALGGIVDVYPIAAVTKERKGEVLAPLAELADAGAVGFTDDGDPVQDSEIMRRALEYASMFDKPVIQHAQEKSMTRNGVMNEGFASTRLGLPGMPVIAEDVMVARDIALVQYTGARYHVAHMSTAGSTELVRQAKSRGLKVTCEVTPHHFTLTDDVVGSYDTNTKMNPPLRTREDVEALKAGLRDGTIDVIATDHAPHSFDEKQVEYQQAPFGIVGLETAVGLTYSELVAGGVIPLHRMIELLSVRPRGILNLPEIRIEEGQSANLTILDLTAQWIVDPQRFRSKSKNTPFAGRHLTGRAWGIINNNSFFRS